MNTQAQFFNKDIRANIIVEQSSEFYTFKASAENKTPSDYSNLRYDYMIFTTDEEGKSIKNNKEDRFFISSYGKKILSSLTINYTVEEKIILALLIYDDEGSPIGQDRIELPKGGKTDLTEKIEEQKKEILSQNDDQAKPQDGFVLGGLVIENTITKAGRDFYKYFYSEYYNLNITTPKNIIIEEVPGRGRNTRISVEIDDQLLWQFFAQPKKEFLQQMAQTALNRCIAFLQRLQQQKEDFIRY